MREMLSVLVIQFSKVDNMQENLTNFTQHLEEK